MNPFASSLGSKAALKLSAPPSLFGLYCANSIGSDHESLLDVCICSIRWHILWLRHRMDGRHHGNEVSNSF
jgi:hypothetical protein